MQKIAHTNAISESGCQIIHNYFFKFKNVVRTGRKMKIFKPRIILVSGWVILSLNLIEK